MTRPARRQAGGPRWTEPRWLNASVFPRSKTAAKKHQLTQVIGVVIGNNKASRRIVWPSPCGIERTSRYWDRKPDRSSLADRLEKRPHSCPTPHRQVGHLNQANSHLGNPAKRVLSCERTQGCPTGRCVGVQESAKPYAERHRHLRHEVRLANRRWPDRSSGVPRLPGADTERVLEVLDRTWFAPGGNSR